MNHLRYSNFIFVLAVFALFFTGAGASASGLVQFQPSQESGNEVLQINIKNSQPNKVFTVPDPERLVVDVPLAVGKYNVALPSSYKGKLIKAARFGEFNKKTSRFVFDLNESVKVVAVRADGKKLVVEIRGQGVTGSKPEVPTNKNQENKPRAEVNKFEKSKKTTIKTSAKLGEKSGDKSGAKSGAKINSKKSDVLPLVVIDAGHGGVDPGTIGANGTQEKDLVLEYAKALKVSLLKTSKYRVRLTRDDDRFIMLRERVAIARKAGASLFVSIHADSADEEAARGLSVYTVSEKASDKEAEALAARENKSDIIGSMDLSGERPDVADILISLAQRETKNNSALFADLLVLVLGDRVRLLPNTHRFAGFAVLKAPDIPSVLVEVGFLSHPEEEKVLKSKSYREKVVSGIAAGIDSYFTKKGAGL